MIEICVVALTSLAIALYVQARWTAHAIRQRRSGPGRIRL